MSNWHSSFVRALHASALNQNNKNAFYKHACRIILYRTNNTFSEVDIAVMLYANTSAPRKSSSRPYAISCRPDVHRMKVLQIANPVQIVMEENKKLTNSDALIKPNKK